MGGKTRIGGMGNFQVAFPIFQVKKTFTDWEIATTFYMKQRFLAA